MHFSDCTMGKEGEACDCAEHATSPGIVPEYGAPAAKGPEPISRLTEELLQALIKAPEYHGAQETTNIVWREAKRRGFIVCTDGTWSVTDEGRAALSPLGFDGAGI